MRSERSLNEPARATMASEHPALSNAGVTGNQASAGQQEPSVGNTVRAMMSLTYHLGELVDRVMQPVHIQ